MPASFKESQRKFVDVCKWMLEVRSGLVIPKSMLVHRIEGERRRIEKMSARELKQWKRTNSSIASSVLRKLENDPDHLLHRMEVTANECRNGVMLLETNQGMRTWDIDELLSEPGQIIETLEQVSREMERATVRSEPLPIWSQLPSVLPHAELNSAIARTAFMLHLCERGVRDCWAKQTLRADFLAIGYSYRKANHQAIVLAPNSDWIHRARTDDGFFKSHFPADTTKCEIWVPVIQGNAEQERMRAISAHRDIQSTITMYRAERGEKRKKETISKWQMIERERHAKRSVWIVDPHASIGVMEDDCFLDLLVESCRIGRHYVYFYRSDNSSCDHISGQIESIRSALGRKGVPQIQSDEYVRFVPMKSDLPGQSFVLLDPETTAGVAFCIVRRPTQVVEWLETDFTQFEAFVKKNRASVYLPPVSGTD